MSLQISRLFQESELTHNDRQSLTITTKILNNNWHDIDKRIENRTDTNNTDVSSLPNEKSIDDISYDNNEKERQRIEEELHRTKLCLFNTKELLDESELNNVRLNEQIILLKDELRRIERNIDRIESISNLEYLKNVILKFLILKTIPERLQLIPVLVTMLKLSANEQAQLVRIANIPVIVDEYSKNDESSTNDTNFASWRSYLNIW